MKKILIFSVAINLIFIIFFGYLIYKKGGLTFIEIKLRFKPEPILSIMDNPDWKDRKSLFEILPDEPGEIIFLGNSLTADCEWAELFNNSSIKNRGIGGDNTDGILGRLSQITKSHPKKIFIEIGENDLSDGRRIFEIVKNYELIVHKIIHESPLTKIYLQSVLPVNSYYIPLNDSIEVLNKNVIHRNDSIVVLNERINKLANDNSLTFINLHDKYLDGKGDLDMQLSHEGFHLNGKGYLIWKEAIENFVNEP